MQQKVEKTQKSAEAVCLKHFTFSQRFIFYSVGQNVFQAKKYFYVMDDDQIIDVTILCYFMEIYKCDLTFNSFTTF